jgi:hypothetical protein
MSRRYRQAGMVGLNKQAGSIIGLASKPWGGIGIIQGMKRRLLIPVLLLVGLVMGLFLWPEDAAKQTLPDGTVIVLSRLRIGRTNTYTHGTLLSKTLGRLAPSNGVSVAGFKLCSELSHRWRVSSCFRGGYLCANPGRSCGGISFASGHSHK